VLSTVLAGALVLLIISRPGWPGPARSAATGLGLIALCLCGANGVALVPALATWLLAASLKLWQRGERGAAVAAFGAAVPALALVVLYFRGYQGASHHGAAAESAAALNTGLQFLSLMSGIAENDHWRLTGLAALALFGVSVLVTAWAAFRGAAENRPRALGLLFAFGAMGSLALGLAWGRAGIAERAGLEPRYVTLISPLWLIVFFAWDLHTRPALRRVVLASLLAVNLVLLWPQTRAGIEDGREKFAQGEKFVKDVRDGVPLYMLTRRHTPYLHQSQDAVARELAALREAGIGVFASIAPNPAFHEVAVPVTPSSMRLADWKDGKAIIRGVDPELRYVLSQARPVAGIRLRYSHNNQSGGPARFRIEWSSVAGKAPGPEQHYANWVLPTGRDQVTTIWIADVVQEFRIQPDNQRGEFGVEELTLLVP
jgi:hypothetical protein